MKVERLEVRVDGNLLDELDAWRVGEGGNVSRSEAARRLLGEALAMSNGDKMFEILKYQILASAPRMIAEGRMSGSYAFAWEAGVYPLLHTVSLHQPFRTSFSVSEDMVEEVLVAIDDADQEEKLLSFYDLEQMFRVRIGDTRWDRTRLLAACRYIYLEERFSDNVWKALTKQGKSPVEARSIVKKFDPMQLYVA